MSTLLLDRQETSATDPTTRLRTMMAAVRVCFTWFGSRKSLTPEQKSQAADTFDAEGEFLSARKKIARFVAPRDESGHRRARPGN